MNKILVTGGAGYVGSHACKALKHAGFEPVVFDSLVRGNKWAVKWGPLEIGDILDADRLDQVFNKYRPMAVMHFAAFSYVGESVSQPELYYSTNVIGSLTLLSAMRRNDVNKLIFSSSCSTYGMPQAPTIDELHLQIPVNPYGMTKLTTEACIRDFGNAYGMRSIVLRYFNAAGADPDGEIGETHDPETHLIPLAIRSAFGDGTTLTIHGDDYDTIDGTCIRDYVHVSDLANTHVRALERLKGDTENGAYNLGSGDGFSVKQVIDTIEQVSGHPVPLIIGSRRLGDPPVLLADTTRAKRDLDWNPQYSDLPTIIKTAMDWDQSSQ